MGSDVSLRCGRRLLLTPSLPASGVRGKSVREGNKQQRAHDRKNDGKETPVRSGKTASRLCSILLWAVLLGVAPAISQHVSPGDTLRADFVSDTQNPLWPEKLKLAWNNNELAHTRIFDAIVEDAPAAVFHLGDQIALGFLEKSWAVIDSFGARLAARNIPYLPILGNHELIYFAGMGREKFEERFPYASSTGYQHRVGPLAVVLLNSNFGNLSPQDVKKQQAWYEETLARLEKDSTVDIVIVGCHHPPYTNSTIVSPSQEVQQSFVPPFLATSKCRLFVSGHCHAVEHFRNAGKDFLVIGGGGGLQQPLLIGAERRWADEFPVQTELRMFHYMQCRITAEEIRFTIRMLNDDFRSFHDVLMVAFSLRHQ
jgi:hypothetical protein